MKNRIFLSGGIVYIFMLSAGFLSDAIFPNFQTKNKDAIFHGSLSISLTLANLSLLFLLIVVFIYLTSFSQKRVGALDNGLLWRRVFVGLISGLLFVGLLFCSIYILSKKVNTNEAGILYHSLMERKEVKWSEIEKMNGNFIPGSRLGLIGKGNYAWVDFTTTNGKNVHFSLRFIRGVSELEEIITQKINEH